MNCGPLTESKIAGTSCFGIQIFFKALTTPATSAFSKAVSSTQRKNWFIDTSIKMLPVLVFRKVTNRSIAPASPGHPLGSDRKRIFLTLAPLRLPHWMQVFNTIYTSEAMLLHIYLCRKLAYVRLYSICPASAPKCIICIRGTLTVIGTKTLFVCSLNSFLDAKHETPFFAIGLNAALIAHLGCSALGIHSTYCLIAMHSRRSL